MTAGRALRRDAPAWGAALLGAALLCLVFRQERLAAVSVWDSSTAYGHCWLVLPIVAWLLWERRDVLPGLPARPAPWAALIAVPLLLGWAAADLLGLMEGRQLAAIGFVLALLLAALGWRLWWALSAAFLYLVFLVPFGAFVTPALQRFTAGFIEAGLRVLDIPFEADRFQIAIPEGVFYVAEACAGLRFLIASVAFGVLYAVTMFRSPVRRIAFIAVACVVPVVANGFRGLGIVLLGHALGSAEAGAADHLVYGWVFFSTVIVLLALAGLPFRQASPARRHGGEVLDSRAAPAWLAVACLPVLLLAAAGPLLAGREVGLASTAPATPPPAAGCLAGPARAAAGTGVAEFRCGEQRVEVTTTALRHGAGPSQIIEAARGPAMAGLGDEASSEVWTVPGSALAPWVLARASGTGRLSAYAVTVGGVQGVGGLQDRWRMVLDMLGPAHGQAPLAQAVTVQPGGAEGERVLKSVLAALAQARQAAAASP